MQFLTNLPVSSSTSQEESTLVRNSWSRNETRKAGRPKGQPQNGRTAEGQTAETNQTELNRNGSAQDGSPEKDCSDELEKLTPLAYRARCRWYGIPSLINLDASQGLSICAPLPSCPTPGR